ncbi:MAG TPA: AbrB/MazE/SpoVT family DNA-binding domain-containing protein [Acidimicrobiales bacterium]|jgi:AbrB family looped-hinge helix DNA binding protein|nr:AbrB/MazE/SpoVT family DNA-binding domain-containing protein [Acidimicrobiales bacterium]
MKSTIDKAGRVVIPKSMREAAGLGQGAEISIALRDGRIEIEAAPQAVVLERHDGVLVAVPVDRADHAAPLTDDDVRTALETLRP